MFIQGDGRTPFFICFFLSLIFVSFHASSACVDFWSKDGDRASDMFIQFAQEHLGENWSEKMNSKKYKGYSIYATPWKREVVSSTQKWSSKDARKFLDILVNRVGELNTCYLLARSLSHLKNISQHRQMSQDILQNFKERIAFYDDYMGEEVTTEMMQKSLAGFTEGELDQIKELAEFLESYLRSRELVIRTLTRDPHIFSVTEVDEIQPVLTFLETIISHETLTEMMTRKKGGKRHGHYLSLSKLKALRNILQPLMDEVTLVDLKKRNSLQREVLELAELNYDHLFHIKKQVSVWINYSGLPAVSQVMKKSLEILHDRRIYALGVKVKNVEGEIRDKKPVIHFAMQNPEFFVRSNEEEFLKRFWQWRFPPAQKSNTQQRQRRKGVRNINPHPSQMVFFFPE